MGLRPLFDDMVARLAADHGWAVCAPEPFPGHEDFTLDQRFGHMPNVTDDERLGDLLACADVLERQGGVERIGVLGFCMGAMYALKAAGTGRFDRAVAFYGMITVPDAWKGDGHGEPLEWLSKPSPTKVLAIVGGRDTMTPPDDVAALRTLADRIEIAFYPEAEHGFVHDPSRPSHRPDDAADAWSQAISFLS
ncbi:MAG: carboxymethylenebutenolidase [Acidimicrobiaceae bacterium]|nr:carboxymethylenebutenolidase [Acidimicrobiaceae bacterium]